MNFVANLLGITDDDLQWAVKLGKLYGKDEERDGQGDAARHLGLGWLASRSKFPALALFAINAREYLTMDIMIDMDIHNNKLGFSINADTPVKAKKAIIKLVDSGQAKFYTQEQSKFIRGEE